MARLTQEAKINAGSPASPHQHFEGLTKREAMAMAALQGLLAKAVITGINPGTQLARLAVANADALLNELAEETTNAEG